MGLVSKLILTLFTEQAKRNSERFRTWPRSLDDGGGEEGGVCLLARKSLSLQQGTMSPRPRQYLAELHQALRMCHFEAVWVVVKSSDSGLDDVASCPGSTLLLAVGLWPTSLITMYLSSLIFRKE